MKQKWSFLGFVVGLLVGSGFMVFLGMSKRPLSVVPAPVVEVAFSPLIERVNQERTQVGVLPLLGLRHLHEGAASRAAFLIASDQWSHAGYEASLSATTWAVSGKLGENLARGYQTEDAVVVAWLTSPLHASVIFDAKFRYGGVGRVDTYWVLWLTENP